jgi:polyferredoxin
MAGRRRLNIAAVLVATLGVFGMVWSALMFALWLSAPVDMSRGLNPATMTVYVVVAALSAGATYFGGRNLRR